MLNKVMLIGYAGADSEMKFTAAGIPVANFSLAVNETYKNGDGEKKFPGFRFMAIMRDFGFGKFAFKEGAAGMFVAAGIGESGGQRGEGEGRES